VATEVREHEERGHSARYLILIFLVLVAMCGVFFSAGFIVGRNERSLHSAPPTEVVTSPGVIPPTVNPPPESAQVTPQDSGTGHAAASSAPDTVVIPPGGAGANPAPPTAKPADVAPATEHPMAGKPASNPPSPPAPAAGEVGEGITLQVVALRNKPDAEAVVNILKEKGYPVFLVTPEYARATDNLFRVQVGPFKTRDDADKVKSKLTQEGFKPFIKH
jgi:DedD protein